MASQKYTRQVTCPWWYLFTFDNFIRNRWIDPQKFLKPYVKEGSIVLDVGCGMGFTSIPLARLVGPGGKVISADLQERMLAGLKKRAAEAGVMDRIECVHSAPDSIGIKTPVDFALAFWMFHEVGDMARFLREIHAALKPHGRLLLVEPLVHVPLRRFERSIQTARDCGFRLTKTPRIFFSRAALLEKTSDR